MGWLYLLLFLPPAPSQLLGKWLEERKLRMKRFCFQASFCAVTSLKAASEMEQDAWSACWG